MLPNYRYKGRHRAPSSAGETAVKVAAAGAVAALPVVAAPAAQAGPANGWGAVIECESGGDPRAQNPSSTASGLFQFINGTWRAYGGGEFASRAKDATVAEQYIVAERAYAAEGLKPWAASKSCWAGRTVAEPPKPEPAPQTSPDRGAPARPAAGDTLTVKAGDTLGELASAHGITWRVLFDANRDVVEDPDLIFPGERLALP